jgi:colanic acid/amylovoran biosynthesis glycosyltransferase
VSGKDTECRERAQRLQPRKALLAGLVDPRCRVGHHPHLHGDEATDAADTVRRVRVVVMVDRFPVLTETFVVNELLALRAAGHEVRVEALERGDVEPPVPTTYRRPGDLLWLLAHHPLGCARDLLRRRRLRREEWVRPLREIAPVVRRLRDGEHIHVHFAAGAALDALRIAALAGAPYSVTAHAWDIWLAPRNLRAKLERAAFVTTGCEYNARHLRTIAPRAKVHVVVMGVDGERLRRSTPLPGGRTVLGIGRLVPKKGFGDLARAAGGLDARVRIVGDGPLRDELARAVEVAGALDPDGVRAELERADVLAMPCVVAPDGDRDSMPVVVKEAMAMELMVVATDEVGLPECVREPWGRLVPPGDPDALRAAIEQVLALSPDERAAAGSAGRQWVLEHADVHRETARLAALIAAVGS